MKVVEEFAQQQERIYPDACDYGYRWKDTVEGKRQVKRLRNAVVSLMSMFEFVTNKWGDESNGGKTMSMFIPYEVEGSIWNGIRLEITTNWDSCYDVIFTYIHMARTTQDHAGFKNND